MQKICLPRFTDSTKAELAQIPKDFLRRTAAGTVLLLAMKKKYSATQIAKAVNAGFQLQGDNKLGPMRVGRICKIDAPKVVAGLTSLYKLHRIRTTAAAATAIMASNRDIQHNNRRHVPQINKILCLPPYPSIATTGLHQNISPRFVRTALSGAIVSMPTKQHSQLGTTSTKRIASPQTLEIALYGKGRNNPFIDERDEPSAMLATKIKHQRVA
ncbi:MAG: hypothetical protein AAF959_01115 [Cyanobacteria bacterium P01_D01_bin.56]